MIYCTDSSFLLDLFQVTEPKLVNRIAILTPISHTEAVVNTCNISVAEAVEIRIGNVLTKLRKLGQIISVARSGPGKQISKMTLDRNTGILLFKIINGS